jgi:hypothetical protein
MDVKTLEMIIADAVRNEKSGFPVYISITDLEHGVCLFAIKEIKIEDNRVEIIANVPEDEPEDEELFVTDVEE